MVVEQVLRHDEDEHDLVSVYALVLHRDVCHDTQHDEVYVPDDQEVGAVHDVQEVVEVLP